MTLKTVYEVISLAGISVSLVGTAWILALLEHEDIKKYNKLLSGTISEFYKDSSEKIKRPHEGYDDLRFLELFTERLEESKIKYRGGWHDLDERIIELKAREYDKLKGDKTK